MKHTKLTLIIGALMLATLCPAAIVTKNLRCEYLADPLGIDATSPRLSWVLDSDQRGEKQTAYQVLVASSPKILGDDKGDLWDSGKVATDETAQISYAGTVSYTHLTLPTIYSV